MYAIVKNLNNASKQSDFEENNVSHDRISTELTTISLRANLYLLRNKSQTLPQLLNQLFNNRSAKTTQRQVFMLVGQTWDPRPTMVNLKTIVFLLILFKIIGNKISAHFFFLQETSITN